MALIQMARPNGPLIQQLRQDLGYSRTELAHLIRVDPNTVYRVERGGYEVVSKTMIGRFARGLGVKAAKITLPDKPASKPEAPAAKTDRGAAA